MTLGFFKNVRLTALELDDLQSQMGSETFLGLVESLSAELKRGQRRIRADTHAAEIWHWYQCRKQKQAGEIRGAHPGNGGTDAAAAIKRTRIEEGLAYVPARQRLPQLRGQGMDSDGVGSSSLSMRERAGPPAKTPIDPGTLS
jgi:hypothetical protein